CGRCHSPPPHTKEVTISTPHLTDDESAQAQQVRPDKGTADHEPQPVLVERPVGGIPQVIDTEAQLEYAAEKLRKGNGPVAVDTERASGYRYGQRAFLIQLKRNGDTIWLIDPEALESLQPLQKALEGVEWILHAAIQD